MQTVTHALRLLFIVLLTATLPGASAATLYVQFSGTGTGSGMVNDVPFTNVDWTLEFGVDSNAVDSSTDPNVGFFDSGVVSGALRLGSTTYQLADDSTTGRFDLWNQTDASDRGAIGVNPTSGGYVFFITSATAVVPSVFTNPNNVGSLVVGSSVSNTIPDGYGNVSSLRFEYDDDPDFGMDERLVTTGGSRIQFNASAPSGSGAMTVSITDLSIVPEPAVTGALFAVGGLLLVVIRRRITSTHSQQAFLRN